MSIEKKNYTFLLEGQGQNDTFLLEGGGQK